MSERRPVVRCYRRVRRLRPSGSSWLCPSERSPSAHATNVIYAGCSPAAAAGPSRRSTPHPNRYPQSLLQRRVLILFPRISDRRLESEICQGRDRIQGGPKVSPISNSFSWRSVTLQYERKIAGILYGLIFTNDSMLCRHYVPISNVQCQTLCGFSSSYSGESVIWLPVKKYLLWTAVFWPFRHTVMFLWLARCYGSLPTSSVKACFDHAL